MEQIKQTSKNSNLHAAKRQKLDCFYTLLSDVENELRHYKKHFKDKVIYCNADDTCSAFWMYFHLNFNELGLKKLIATHYDAEKPTYKLEYYGENDNDINASIKTDLRQNGDFRSEESIEILKECDILVTNPSFTYFRDQIAQVTEYDKDFILWANNNAITYKEFFPHLKSGKVKAGYTFNKTQYFTIPEDYPRCDEKYTDKMNDGKRYAKVPAITVFTTLDIPKHHEELVLWQRYYDDDGNPLPEAEERYPHYDNYPQAINVDKVADIPCDYYGVMGVPITILDHLSPKQFQIIGISGDLAQSLMIDSKKKSGRFYVKGKRLYDRIVIQRVI